MRRVFSIGPALALSTLLAGQVLAADHTWNGTGDWLTTSANWTGGVPTMAVQDPVEIATGTVEYDPSGPGGGDFRFDSVLTIDSGTTFQQKAGNGAWLKIGDSHAATLNVSGTFIGLNGVGGNFFAGNGAVGNINILGGTLTTSADLVVQQGSVVTSSGATGLVNLNTAVLQLQNGTVDVTAGSKMQFNNINQSSGAVLTVETGGTLAVNQTINQAGTAGVTVQTGGALTANTLSSGSGTTWVKDSGSSINVANYNPNTGTLKISNGGTFTQTGGNLAINVGTTFQIQDAASMLNLTQADAGELQIRGGTATVSGGTINIRLISFNNGDADVCKLELSGGTINIGRGDFFNGIFSIGGDNRYVDFTTNSTAIMFLANGTVSSADSLITGNVLRYNSALQGNLSDFLVTSVAGGVNVRIAPTPEPSSVALLGMVGLFGLKRKRAGRVA